MKLAFKNWGFGFTEKEIPISLKIGTLEDLCKELKIEFWQIGTVIKESDFDFMSELLYQGYLTAYKERLSDLRFSRLGLIIYILLHPKYDRVKAILWNEHISKESQKELLLLMTALFGEITKMTTKKGKKKVTKKQPLENSEPLQSEI